MIETPADAVQVPDDSAPNDSAADSAHDGDSASAERLARRRRGVLFSGLAGIASVALGLGAAEVAAALVAPSSSPVFVVGSPLIDLAPSWAKETAIALFGTGDKAALLAGIAIMLVVVAAVAGILERAKPPIGSMIIGAAAVFGLLAAGTRTGAGPLDALPSVVTGIVGVIAIRTLLRRLPTREGGADDYPPATTRRNFLIATGIAGAAGVVAAVVGSALQAGARAATAVRETLKLPKPAVVAPAIPAAADFGIEGLSPVISSNADFYRIDTALQIPRILPADWSLRIHGMVENEIEIGWDELIALPLEESVTTLMCVSNEVGGDLIGNARWLGYPIRELLARAKPKSGADMVLSRSQDGWTAGTPLPVLQDDRNAILAVGMNGEPLPDEHGFPVRMVVPGLYGYVSATKWVTELEVTKYSAASAYWTDRGWGAKGPIKIESRIDVPRGDVSAGDVVVAGVAWHQHTGIAGVQVQVDDGAWQDAELAEAISVDTWVQWKWTWPARSGSHSLRVRAIGADGKTQTADVADVLPDGATGYHEVDVTVS